MRQLRARQAAQADAEENALLCKFAGSVTLTFRADRRVTLTPQQARARSWGWDASCTAVHVSGKQCMPVLRVLQCLS